MSDTTTRSHVIVLLPGERVLLVREVQHGSVHYLAPGVSLRRDETPGKAAERAAREEVGVEVVVEELLYADTERGAEHYFFLARLKSPVERDWEDATARPDGQALAAVKRSALLGYPVRPVEIARLIPRTDSPRRSPPAGR